MLERKMYTNWPVCEEKILINFLFIDFGNMFIL